MSDVKELQILEYNALDELLTGLSDAEWDAQTECPGWSVKDNISHIIGTEAMLLGRDRPDHDPGEQPHIKNPIGASNEVEVDFRRSRTPAEVLAEFREVTGERTAALQNLTEDDLAAESWTPIGPGTLADLLAIRTMDCWVHEQDIRRAIGKPGNLDNAIAKHAFGRHSGALGFVVGKKVGAPDGTTVVYDVAGQGIVSVGVDGGRAKVLSETPSDPTVSLSMDMETFNRLCCGRGDPAEVGKNVTVTGDAELAQKLIANSSFMI